MNQLIGFLSILRKDMKTYYLKPPNISWGIIFPISWTLMFFAKSESTVDLREILPGVMALSILFGTTSMLAVTITFERRSRSFERLLLAPLDLNLLMMAKTTGAIVFGVLNAFVPIVFSLFWISLSGVAWVSLIVSILLIAITSTFLGLLIAVSVREVFEAQTFSNFFRFPMIFLCGLFIPIEKLPVMVRPLSYVLPLTYGVDMLKFSVNNNGFIPLWASLLALVGYSIGLFLISTHNIQKRWIY